MKCSALLLALNLPGIIAAQETYYPPLIGDAWDTVDPVSLGWCTDQLPALLAFLDENNTKAFIVLKDGRIAIEAYFAGFHQDSTWYWASAGKTLTAFLVGKAQQEGMLSLTDPSSQYLGAGWTSCTSEEEQAITILDQLRMTTGLDDTVSDLDCTDPECLDCMAIPGTRWSYHNAPYTRLDGVIAGATGQTLNAYFIAKLLVPTGITGGFFPLGYNNVFFSRARSMARFGLLMQGGGTWNGNTVLNDPAYHLAMTTPSQDLNPAYGYLWWLNGQERYMVPGLQMDIPGPLMPNAPMDTYSGLGANGQCLNVVPSKGMVVVRMGDLPGTPLPIAHLFNDQIWEYLNAVLCEDVGLEGIGAKGTQMPVRPNPASDLVHFTKDTRHPVVAAEAIGVDGRRHALVVADGQASVAQLAAGTWTLRLALQGGTTATSRLVIIR